jgi:alpha-tubulin suppressor-like RCC1 family protein
VALPSGKRAKSISAGAEHTLAILSSGEVYSWGNNSAGQLGFNTSTTSANTPQLLLLP